MIHVFQIDQNRVSVKYFPSFKLTEMIGLLGRAIGRIISSFMVITASGQEKNIGLRLKFKSKAVKVIEYSQKDGRFREIGERVVKLFQPYQRLCSTL
jgi:5'-3' exoribonuclease 1